MTRDSVLSRLVASPVRVRRLEELDDLAPNDPERDEVCKGLSRDDQRALMARYGFTWPPAGPQGGES